MIPPSLQANPSLDRWVSFPHPGKVRVAFGKVEYGQGAATGLAQIAAEELDVAWERLEVVNAATGAVPDEGLTVGSMSIETSGASLRAAAAEVRLLFAEEAARQLGCTADELDVSDGAFLRGGEHTGLDYWVLASQVDLALPSEGRARWKTPDRHRIVGRSLPRIDLPPKVFGAAFLHDRLPDGVVHARVLHQPGPQAKLAGIDEAAVRRAAGEDIDIVREASLIAFLSPSERAVSLAVVAAEQLASWDNARVVAPEMSEPISLKSLPANPWSGGAPPPETSNRRRIQAAYGKPYIDHGSIGPSCGLARFEDGALTVWTHAQGVYPLRGMLARLTGLPPEQIRVEHAQGPGCYGHNGADDAACDAAAIAMRRPGQTIRVQWRREDEFACAPVGTAMHIEYTAELDAAGRLVDFASEIWSGPHVGRGGMLAERALNPDAPIPPPMSMPGFSGGRLNAIPSYDIPATRVTENLVIPPVRTSSLRGLGGPPNTYGGECFIDELAEAAGQDPLAFRMSMLSDPRSRAVLQRLAQMAGWSARTAGGDGKGLGLAFDRHRDRGAYVAVAVALEVDAEVRLKQMWCVADCGLVINPDGVKNQVEGGMIMAASWALKGAGAAGGQWHRIHDLGRLSDPAVQRGSAHRRGADRPADVGALRGRGDLLRPDAGGHR
ncbi:MAG: molybdopterin cofactor-binding domain-containing protein [Caulobacterales bacterium]